MQYCGGRKNKSSLREQVESNDRDEKSEVGTETGKSLLENLVRVRVTVVETSAVPTRLSRERHTFYTFRFTAFSSSVLSTARILVYLAAIKLIQHNYTKYCIPGFLLPIPLSFSFSGAGPNTLKSCSPPSLSVNTDAMFPHR